MSDHKQLKRRGFTLIEVIGSMMVLSVILVLMVQIFSGATRSMEVGIDSSQQLSSGRAAVDFMARELSMATAGDLLAMKANTTEIYFVALEDDVSASSRLANQVHYYTATETDGYSRTVLKRSVASSITTVKAYTNSTWWAGHPNASDDPIVADNVNTFTVKLYDKYGNTASPYDSNAEGPPVYAEIYLELLGESQALKASLIGGAGAASYRARMARPFFRRVYFNNYLGYNRDGP